MNDTVKNENMFSDERKDCIVQYVNKNRKTTVNNLCDYFNVSPATIRNDLRDLEANGLLKRTHGGALSNQKISYELESNKKSVKNIAEKTAIARAALEYIEDGDSIVMDTGTTTFELAKMLTEKENLVVVTNDLNIATFLEKHTNTKILLTGGMVRNGYNCLVGSKAIDSIKDISVDKAFIATNCFNGKKGATTPSMDMAQIKGAMIKMADEVILLCTSKKIDKVSFIKFADAKDFDSIIIDDGISENKLKELQSTEVEIEVVKIEK